METANSLGAVAELHKAVALEPDNVAAHFRLATLYRSMGKKDEARAEYARANTLNKKLDEPLHQRLADADSQSGQASKPDAAKPDRP
jgi:Flp pilus assembly protein TadD